MREDATRMDFNKQAHIFDCPRYLQRVAVTDSQLCSRVSNVSHCRIADTVQICLWMRVVVDLAGAYVCGWAGSMTPSIQYERVLQRDPRLNNAANNLSTLLVTQRKECSTNVAKIPMRLMLCRRPSTSPFSSPSSAITWPGSLHSNLPIKNTGK